MAERVKKSYFFENTKQELADGSTVPGNRFLDMDVPIEETFRKLIDSIPSILEKADKAKVSEQGLVKTVNGNTAKAGTTPNDDFTFVAQIKNLPVITEVSQIIKDLNAVLVTVSKNNNELDKNDFRLSLSSEFTKWLTTQLDTLASDISNVNSPDISGLISEINQLASDVNDLSDEIEVVETLANSNKSEIDALEARVKTNEDDIVQLGDEVAAINISDNRYLGEVIFRAFNTAPNSSWVIANGQAVSRTTYAGLFAAIGVSYGVGDGSTTFNIPNLEGKGVRGYNGVGFPLAGNGGNDSVTIGVSDLPEHQHPIGTVTSDGSIDLCDAVGSDNTTVPKGDGTPTGTLTTDTTLAGAVAVNGTTNDALDITNPYLVLIPFIKIL